MKRLALVLVVAGLCWGCPKRGPETPAEGAFDSIVDEDVEDGFELVSFGFGDSQGPPEPITLRSVKGSNLTPAEADDDIENLWHLFYGEDKNGTASSTFSFYLPGEAGVSAADCNESGETLQIRVDSTALAAAGDFLCVCDGSAWLCRGALTEASTSTLTNKTINTASNTLTIVEADISDLSHTTDTDTQLTQEQVEDFAGALVGDGTGTHTGISVTYQDATADVDMVVDHDAAQNFLVAEHVDWAGASAGTIHSTNYVDNDTVFSPNADPTVDHSGSEAALEAVMDLEDMQGTVTDAQVPDTITATNYQPIDTELTTLAGLAETNGAVIFAAGGAWTTDLTPAIDCTDCTNVPGGTVNTADIADVSVTQTELAELETIGATTISANQWAALGSIAETLTSTELDLLDGITTLSGSNTGDQDLADTVAEITDLDDDAATLSLPASTTISAFGATLVDDAAASNARTTLGVDVAGTDNSTDVTLAGTPDYFTISGQVITRGQVDLAADVTGDLPVTNLNGGTSASSATYWRGDGTWSSPSGSGDVVGPASATDNGIARFDTTTGKLLQDTSAATVSDGGLLSVTVGLDAIGPVDLDYGSADVTDHTFTTDGTGTAEIVLPAGSIDSTEILDATVAIGDLAAGTDGELVSWDASGNATTVAVGTSGHVLTSNGAGAAPTFQAAAGGGSMPVKEFQYPAASLRGNMDAGNNWPAPLHDEGTNLDIDTLGFDDSADECAGGQFIAPSEIDTSGTVTFRTVWYSGTATSGNIMWDIRHTSGQAEGVTWDSSLTTEAAAADATQGTVDQLTVTTWTETVSNLAWAASDMVSFNLCRDANHASDTLVGDAALYSLTIEVPRS